MNGRLSRWVAGSAAGSVLLALAAAAEPPQPMPQKKIDHPLLQACVGEWAVTWSMQGPQGPQSGTGTSKIAMAIGDTAMVEDYSADIMGGFHGHGVIKVSDDGKSISNWWFDSMGAEPLKLTGPLSADSATMEGDAPGMGRLKIVWKKAEGGFDFEGTADGKPWLSQKYRKK
jgi:hypothetical protein